MWRSDLPQSKSPLRFFLFSSAPHWQAAVLGVVLSATAAAASTVVSYAFKLIVNAAQGVSVTGNYDPLYASCFFAIFLLALAKLFWRLSGYAGARWAVGAAATSRYALTSYVTLHSRSYFSDRFAGSIMTKIRHAVAGMREIVDMFLWQFLELAVSAVVSFFIAYFVSPLIGWIFFAWIVIILSVNIYLGYKRVPLAVRAHELETLTNGATVDLLTNVSAMQEFARREFELERLKGATEDRRIAHLKSWYFGEHTRSANSVLLVAFGSAMVVTSISLAQAGIITLGDVVLIVTIIFRIEGLLQSLGSNFNHFAEVWGEIHESLEEIIEPHEIPDKPHATALAVPHGEIHFENVSFSYAESPVFRRLSFTIKPGERVGLVGRSGAGKSTLVRLLLHHHDLEGGAIKIDGTDIANVSQESLRSAISIVPQDPLLFHRTIRENIAYGKPKAPDEAIQEAARLAQAHEFIERLPKGYEALVGERGIKLSGGERQRVVIARAIIKDAPILLLDEATSALDSESELAIQKALRELMRGKTVIAIAHRLSTLREMDRIIVLDHGVIAQEGTHKELLEKGGIYADLWRHQAGGFMLHE